MKEIIFKLDSTSMKKIKIKPTAEEILPHSVG